MAGIGQDYCAIGEGDVTRQLAAPAGRVQADDHRSRQQGGAEGEQVLGHVVEQDTDVGRTLGGEATQPGRPRLHVGDHLGPCPAPAFEDQTDTGIAGPGTDDVRRGDQPLRGQWTATRSTPRAPGARAPEQCHVI
jgi:hypothetical protein